MATEDRSALRFAAPLCSDGPFNHDTGKGWVKGKQGEYHDALFNKNNRVEIVLHENLGGGFSPPAAQKMRRNCRKAKDHGVDRTPYQGDRKISYVSYPPGGTRDVRGRSDFSRFDPRPEGPRFSNFGPPAERRPFFVERRSFCETPPAVGL